MAHLSSFSYCNDCRDLDLCRDDELARHSWNCRVCGQPYSQPALEQRLVLALQHRVKEYQLQDLQCVRCKQVGWYKEEERVCRVWNKPRCVKEKVTGLFQ